LRGSLISRNVSSSSLNLGQDYLRISDLFVVAQSFTTYLADHQAKTTDFGCDGYSKDYFHTNLLFPSVRARSQGAVLGAGMIPLSMCLGSIVLPLLNSPFEIRKILY
jgi:hypothetical protein